MYRLYVPTLGPLARDLTQVSRYEVGAEALRSADRLADRGEIEQAAAMYRLACHVAETLAEAVKPVSTRLHRGWLGTAHAVELRARRHDVSLDVPAPRSAEQPS